MASSEYRRTRARCGSTARPNTTPSQCPLASRVTIQSVSDEVLLNIFRYFLHVSPRDWPRLVHTCRKWRQIVFASQQALRLRLFCTHGTPVQKTFNFWHAVPIVVQYGGSPELDPPAPEDEENIMAALRQSSRVISIKLTVTTPLLARLSTIESPFSELEDLALLSQDSVRCLIQPRGFRSGQWGTRLRSLHLTRIAFLELPQLLYSSRNIVDLQLHEVLYPSDFSTEALMNAFAGMTQLRSLSLHYLPPTSNRHLPILPHGKLVALPSLTRFDFRGIRNFLKDVVARIHAPRLGDIEVTCVNEPSDSDLSVFLNFIDRIKMHKSPCQADILSSEHDITVSLTQRTVHTCLQMKLLCEPLTVQLSSMARICIHFSELLSNVEDLRINVKRLPRQGGLYNESWLETVNLFIGGKWLKVSGNLSSDVVNSLHPQHSTSRWRDCVLPSLHVLQPELYHASLREAIVSLMTPWRSTWRPQGPRPFGRPIPTEYEQVLHPGELLAAVSQPVTIKMLPEGVLLNIFRHCLVDTPRIWPILTWVCQGWRQIILTSPLGLNLRLYCTYGTPVLKTLDCFPALPIVVQYGGSSNLIPPPPEDDDNIIAALQQSGRVSSVSLIITNSLHEKLSAISEPLSELEELVLLSQDDVQRTLPNTFQWGPRLRALHSTGIAFPLFLSLLLPCQNLIDLQLHEIPSAGYFSPEAFANALSATPQLRSLTLHLLSFPRPRSLPGLPPQPGERIILPALTNFKYRGTSKYLDNLVARIDAVHLGDIDITLFNQPTMDASQIGRFIERTEMRLSLRKAKVKTSADTISISFANSNTSTPFRLHIACKQLDWQLSCMAQICDQVSPFLSRVSNLLLVTTQPLGGQDDRDGLENGGQWLDLLRSFKFSGARRFWVAIELTTDILCALGPANEGSTAMLPSLRQVRLQKPIAMDGPSWDSVQSFITARSISSRPVKVKPPSYQCHICHASFQVQHGLKGHLRDKHGYQILCSYCGDFECTLSHLDLFRKQLGSQHSEIMHNDTLIIKPSLTHLQLSNLVNRYSSLRAPAPDIVPPTSESTELRLHPSIARDSDGPSDASESDSEGRLD